MKSKGTIKEGDKFNMLTAIEYVKDISEEQFNWLTTQNCIYCGVEPLGLIRADERNGEYKYNGIDRVDSKQGYIFNNCVSCCKFCNMAKREYPVEEFLAWIERLKTFNSNICL